MKLTFLGATKTVTGSKYLVGCENKNILVDCGLFQGLKELRLRNWSALPFSASSIDAVVLTHAHIDHSGYLPRLVQDGFNGPIYCTQATYDLCRIMLPDSGHLQEEEAAYANRYGYSKHHPALPLYSEKQAYIALQQFEPLEFAKPCQIGSATVCLHRVGHILGAAMVQIIEHGVNCVFSGDVGRMDQDLIRAPVPIPPTEYLVLESTYGDRQHSEVDPVDQLEAIINRTVARGGKVIIPAFAVGRAQHLLIYLYRLRQAGKLLNLPIYLDSPMASKVTELFCHYHKEYNLSLEQARDIANMADYVDTPDDSKKIDMNNMPMIIISASGMATGGRVLYHLAACLEDHRNTIVFTGFQAGGTRGADMLAGKQQIKLLGRWYQVKAEIAEITNTSAHADHVELMQWLKQLPAPPRKIFLTHGEKAAINEFAKVIERELNLNVVAPDYQDEFMLE